MNITTAQIRAAGLTPRGTQPPQNVPKAKRGMNRWEARYAAHLALQQQAGLVTWWRFEAMRLRIGEGCVYVPDFIVVLPSGKVEAREVKGWERDDAVTKFKCAAEQFPWITFRMFKLQGGEWIETRTLNERVSQ